MLHLKNFKKYFPDTKEEKEIERKFNAIFYHSEDGYDWYKSLPLFKEKTYKIKYDANNVVVAFNTDASKLCPDNGSIVELDSLPDDVDTFGNWQYINDMIVPREYTLPEILSQAKRNKQELLIKANMAISPLQDAVDLKIATEKEQKMLDEWKKYRILLSRIDCSSSSEIDWPEKPE
ncbi:tail fiber assembly protein [Xenorhabdus budapestensis]|uniref:Tail fiber assembly protein n=1 Tax=Xenorhabdus budapestensis TaxID=290110 RepID=A0ABX7VJP9_XENBU|nr:tail fiber assembly protein [Xenorhabdus budapestensis]QTL39153.1 tail fiber assembly protein [Xenorhabdus budapestensis]